MESGPEANFPPSTIHGSSGQVTDRERAREADARAQELLAQPEVSRLLCSPTEQRTLARARQVYVNRNLRLSQIDLIGFDMDYTLAIYHLRRIEKLSFDMTVERLIRAVGYPPELRQIAYDHQFGLRGIFVDKAHGNLIKMDRFGYVGRAYHGRKPLDDATWQKLYRDQPIRVRDVSFAWIDTLFALPEACLYAGMIDLLEGRRTLDYGRLYDDIREAIDTVHRDNSLKAIIQKDIGHYIFKDPELGPSLHKLRSGGKRLFLLTNSLWDYTHAVMSYLLDGVLPEYPSWRNYFDLVAVGASKPAFFSEQRPFIELDVTRDDAPELGEAHSLERLKVYRGGNLAAFERMSGYSGDRVLYVGDHIYGDILKSKKTSLWRTCMVVQELEDEINYTDSRHKEIGRLSDLEAARSRLDDEISGCKQRLNMLERRGDKSEALETERKATKAELDGLRRAHREATQLADLLERDLEEGFNPFWGLLFKEGHENSRFGEQVEQYACLYTSRVSNLLHYSPMQYFRSGRAQMPHERAGALSGMLSVAGRERGPRGNEHD